MKQHLTEGIYYVLLALYVPRHGYEIIKLVKEMSNGRVQLSSGTTYGILKNLNEKKWIERKKEIGRKKEYIITHIGELVVEQEILKLKELYANGIIISNNQGNQ